MRYPNTTAAYEAGVRAGIKQEQERQAAERQRGEAGAAEPDALTFEDLRKLTPEQVNQQWDSVSRVLAEGRS